MDTNMKYITFIVGGESTLQQILEGVLQPTCCFLRLFVGSIVSLMTIKTRLCRKKQGAAALLTIDGLSFCVLLNLPLGCVAIEFVYGGAANMIWDRNNAGVKSIYIF